MSTSPHLPPTNTSTTFSSSIQLPSISNQHSLYSHSGDIDSTSAQNSPFLSYAKNSKLDLKIDLNSSSSNTLQNTVTQENVTRNENKLIIKETVVIVKESITPCTPDDKHNFAFTEDLNNEEVDDKDIDDTTCPNIKEQEHGRTPTPKIQRQTPSIHVKDNDDFPATEPIMDSICENEEHENESKEVTTSESDVNDEDDDDIVRSEEEIEQELLGRFGYTKVKTITKTLQGNIFVAKVENVSSQGKDGKKRKEKQVVIKKTSKQLHSEHVTVQNGKKFGIYENILKECIILKHLTENRNGLIMTSFTKYDNFFDDDNYYYLSMEHGGSDLFDFIIEAHELISQKKLKIKEWRKFTKYLFWQMIVVLKWLHNDMNICHLDISLENILIKNGDFIPIDNDKTQYTINSNVQIKICDFGMFQFILYSL